MSCETAQGNDDSDYIPIKRFDKNNQKIDIRFPRSLTTMSNSLPSNNNPSGKSRIAWVHIGCEKTGTSSIQKFLLENQKILALEGLYFPIECGLLSNHRLHWIIDDDPNLHPFAYHHESGMGNSLEIERSKFTNEHYEKVNTFQTSHRQESHVVYSSEHLHSRVYNTSTIQALKDWLLPLYDDIKIVVYLRRQDKLALSAYSTHLRGGTTEAFRFPQADIESPYFGYRKLVNQWASVFGKSNVLIKHFEKKQLHKESIVDDFGRIMDFDFSDSIYDLPVNSNTSLSHAAKYCLIQINRKIAKHDTCSETSARWQPVKDEFIKFVESTNVKTSDKDTHLATRTDAKDFYNRFTEDNAQLFSEYQLDWDFSDDFTMYSESNQTVLNDLLKDSETVASNKDLLPQSHEVIQIRKQAAEIINNFGNSTSAENKILLDDLSVC